jgi:hypothetical protein
MTIPPTPTPSRVNSKILGAVIAFLVATAVATIYALAAFAPRLEIDESAAPPPPKAFESGDATPAPVVAPTPSALVNTIEASPPVEPADETADRVVVTDGTHLVGRDIPPGTYGTEVPGAEVLCYWERERDTSGTLDGVIANDVATPGSSVIVTILKTDAAFKTSGCGIWTLIKASG